MTPQPNPQPNQQTNWWIYDPNAPKDKGHIETKLKETPPWISDKQSGKDLVIKQKDESNLRGKNFRLDYTKDDHTKDDFVALTRINMALYLRKPMLVRGEPGVGKSSLAYSLAYHLGLGEVIRWPITSHTSIKDGLYRYDALDDLSKVIKVKEGEAREPREPRFYLGPLGQAVAQMGEAPAVLLLDEIDKSDMDLPNDLLHFLEDPSFRIDELVGRDIKANIKIIGADGKEGYQQPDNNGRIKCIWFPIIVMTSNQERPLPPAFLRRCITVKFDLPSEEKLIEIAKGWFPNKEDGDIRESVKKFIKIRTDNNLSLSTDACLQGVYQFIQTGRLDELEELYNSLNTNGHG